MLQKEFECFTGKEKGGAVQHQKAAQCENSWWGAAGQAEADAPQCCPVTGWGREHKPKCKQFHLNKGKHMLSQRVTKLWNRLPRGYGVSSHEDTQSLTGRSLEQPPGGDPAWAGGWTRSPPAVLLELMLSVNLISSVSMVRQNAYVSHAHLLWLGSPAPGCIYSTWPISCALV